MKENRKGLAFADVPKYAMVVRGQDSRLATDSHTVTVTQVARQKSDESSSESEILL
jgi:hypothetical protein